MLVVSRWQVNQNVVTGIRALGSKIQYWIINWIIFFVKIQWIFGRSQVKGGKKRVERGKIHSTGFYWIFENVKIQWIFGRGSLDFRT